MGGENTTRLTIDIMSRKKESLNDAFVSVLSEETANHGWSKDGSISFTAPFDSLVNVTVHHSDYIPRTVVLSLSSQQLRRSVVLEPKKQVPKQ